MGGSVEKRESQLLSLQKLSATESDVLLVHVDSLLSEMMDDAVQTQPLLCFHPIADIEQSIYIYIQLAICVFICRHIDISI